MSHNRLSNSKGIYTIIQVVHTKFIKVALTDYSVQEKLEEQVAAAVIIALTSEKKQVNKKRKEKRRVCVKPWLKIRKKIFFYETLLAELLLQEEYSYNILLRMTSEKPEEIFQLIKDDIPKENTKLRELVTPRM